MSESRRASGTCPDRFAGRLRVSRLGPCTSFPGPSVRDVHRESSPSSSACRADLPHGVGHPAALSPSRHRSAVSIGAAQARCGSAPPGLILHTAMSDRAISVRSGSTSTGLQTRRGPVPPNSPCSSARTPEPWPYKQSAPASAHDTASHYRDGAAHEQPLMRATRTTSSPAASMAARAPSRRSTQD